MLFLTCVVKQIVTDGDAVPPVGVVQIFTIRVVGVKDGVTVKQKGKDGDGHKNEKTEEMHSKGHPVIQNGMYKK